MTSSKIIKFDGNLPALEITNINSISLVRAAGTLSKEQKERFQKCLTNIVNAPQVRPKITLDANQSFQLDFRLDHQGGLVLKMNGEDRVFIPRAVMAQDRGVFKALLKELEATENTARQNGLGNKSAHTASRANELSTSEERSVPRGFDNLNFQNGRLVFNGLATAAGLGAAGSIPGAPLVQGMTTTVAGILRGIEGGENCYQGIIQRNGEQAIEGALQSAQGFAQATAGTGLIMKGMTVFPGMTASAMAAPLLSYGGIATGAALVAHGGYNWVKATHFKNEWQGRMDPTLPLGTRLSKTLGWIQDQVTLSPIERVRIGLYTPTSEDIKKARANEAQKLLKEKWNDFEIATSAPCREELEKGLPHFKQWMEELQSTNRGEAIEEMERWLLEIQTQSKRNSPIGKAINESSLQKLRELFGQLRSISIDVNHPDQLQEILATMRALIIEDKKFKKCSFNHLHDYQARIESSIESLKNTEGRTASKALKLIREIHENNLRRYTNKLREILYFFQRQVTISKEEEKQIEEKFPLEQKLREAIGKKIQKKWDHFERRTTVECGEMIREKLPKMDSILEKLEAGDAGAVQEATQIIQAVEKANFQARAKAISLIVGGILLIALFTLIILYTGPLAPLILILASLVISLVDWDKLTGDLADVWWQTFHAKKSAELYK